jgi:hypothetical protein
MKPLYKVALFLFFVSFSAIAHAQDTGKVEMADTMRSNGRIYVVVAVMLTIMLGLIIYLVRIDRKVSKLENRN